MDKLITMMLLALSCLSSCNRDRSLKDGDLILEPLNIDIKLKIDSAYIYSFCHNSIDCDTIKKEIKTFYKRRDYNIAWFNKIGISFPVNIFRNQLKNYQYNFSDSSFYNSGLDHLMGIVQNNESGILYNKNNIRKIDLLLTTLFFRYSKIAYGGKAENLKMLEWFIPKQSKDYQTTLDSLILITNKEQEAIPLNKKYFLLKKELKKYRDIEIKGGFPTINPNIKNIITKNDSNYLALKKYFYLTGDLKYKDTSTILSLPLINAIKSFQTRLGLTPTGNLDSMTTLELNKPIKNRIKQIIINMERLRWLPVEIEKYYLLINIPDYKLFVFKNDKPIWVTKIVVGKAATQTTIFKSNVSQIVLNPYWGVPQNMANKEILEHLKRNSNYIANNNMEVLSGNKIINPNSINSQHYEFKIPYTIRQKPGISNALGKIKFLFPNTYDIYLQDTPSKNLFDDSKRAFSHGCIRVLNPQKLATYLIRDSTIWNSQKIKHVLKTDIETRINLTCKTPIYIVYFTTWVDEKGNLNFRNDIYGLDALLSKEIFRE